MDDFHGDADLDAASDRVQKQAVRDANDGLIALRAKGYHHVVVRIARLIEKDGDFSVPGATIVASSDSMLPALPLEAGSLRAIADRLDAEFAKHGTHEAESGYTEDATHLAAELGVKP
jgi:hypothetical protein